MPEKREENIFTACAIKEQVFKALKAVPGFFFKYRAFYETDNEEGLP